MEVFRNKEIKRFCALCLAAGLTLSAAGFLWSPAAGVFALASAAAVFGASLFMTRKRYRDLDALSREINRILHGQEPEERRFLDSDEGELHVLKSDIYKMALTLREQSESLKKEKIFLSDSLSDISHQLKTPLTTMNLLVSLMKKQETTEEEKRDHLNELESLLNRMEWLILSLLKMSRLDADTVRFQKETLPVKTMIQKAAAPLLIPMELRGIAFSVEGEESARFCGDLSWTAEALGNVLKNAMEHTPPGGRISVSFEETPLFTRVVVEDTGRGMDPLDLPHIFERFYRSKRAGDQGVGIGLSLARMILQRQGGTIKAENRRQGGGRFLIKFYKSIV